jgi:uncharacterized protein
LLDCASEATTMDGSTDIFEAIGRDDARRVRALLRDDPAVATARNEDGLSPVLLALYHGREEIVELMLRAGVELDVFEAAAVGHVARLRELVDGESAVISARSADGFTPLHLAAFFGHGDALALLLQRGANANAVSRNPMRVLPLHSAVAGRHSAIARRLVEAGGDVNATQEHGFTALHQAAQNGDADLVDYLLGRGANSDVTLEDGRTPSDLAREHGHPDIAGRLSAA